MLRFILLLSCVFLLNPAFSTSIEEPCSQKQCIAVVDAGSTGSRLHVYAYELDNTNSPIGIKEVYTKKNKPGFATIEPNNIQEYLNTLFAKTPINKTIPVYFYATAGMRLLPPNKQALYYQELKNWFSKQSQWQLMDSKTITGNEEGFYDWLSVNYRLGNLQDNQAKPVGVMDMGGASVQIVFPVQNSTNDHSYKRIKVYGKDISLSVHSFLGLGQTEVSHQFLNSAPCFSNHYPLPDGEEGFGNATECEQEIAPLINAVHGVNKTIEPILSSNPVESWVVIGGLSNLADNKLFHFENNQLSLNGLLNQADSSFCHQDWDKLEALFPNDGYVYGYCLFASYYYALIVEGYGLSADKPIQYLPPKMDVDWTLGVVFNHNSSKEKS